MDLVPALLGRMVLAEWTVFSTSSATQHTSAVINRNDYVGYMVTKHTETVYSHIGYRTDSISGSFLEQLNRRSSVSLPA